MKRFLIILSFLFSITFVSATPNPFFSGFSIAEDVVLDSQSLTVSDTIVYHMGYYSINGSDWQSFSLSGNVHPHSNSWLTGTATSILPPALTSSGEHYVIIYSCSWIGSWDCHDGWQLLMVNNMSSSADILYIVDEGVPLADIIISSSAIPSNVYAANILQKYIREMTGAELPIDTSPSNEYSFHIYVGQSTYTDALGINDAGCEYGGFKMISGADYLVLLGQDDVFVYVGPQTQEEFEIATGEKWETDYYGFSSGASYGIDWRDKRGSLNAVHDFLYMQGVRFYHPGWPDEPGLGTIIPSKNDINISYIHKLVNPDFPMRSLYIYDLFYGHISDYHYGPLAEEAFAWRTSLMDNSFREFTVGSLGGPGHGLRAVIALQTETHPEFYTLDSNLQREIEVSYPNPDLCYPYDIRDNNARNAHIQYLQENFPEFTDEDISLYTSYENDLFNQTVRYVKAMFDLYDVPMVSIMPNDGFSRISYQCRDQSEDEKWLRGMYSNYVWEFVNNVAWEIYNDPAYAGKKVSNSAYTTYLMPPDKLSKPFAPNIEVGIARWRSDDLQPEEKEYYLNLFDDWFSLLASNNYLTGGVETNTLSTYDYYIWNAYYRSTRSIPCYIPHLISEDLQRLKGKSVGEFMEISAYSAWPIYNTDGSSNQDWDAFASTSLDTYITAKLYWDADQDVDALLDEYYYLYYGPARNEMKALVEYVENNYGSMASHPEFLRNIRQMANNALDIAGAETDYGKRIILLLTQINSTYVGEYVDVDSCQILNSSDTIYRLTTDVSSEETCFIFSANGITLDCQGHTITYSTSDIETGTWQADYDHGIDINAFRRGLGDFFKITNCVIQDGGFKQPGNSTGAAIYLDYADAGIIENTIINNPRGPGIEAFGTVWNTYFNNSVSSTLSTAFYEQTNDYAYSSESVFQNNYFYSGQNTAMYLYQGHGNSIINNTIISDAASGLYLNLCNNNTMRNNTISGITYGYLDMGENNDLDDSNIIIDN